jgi:hypothetical protein
MFKASLSQLLSSAPVLTGSIWSFHAARCFSRLFFWSCSSSGPSTPVTRSSSTSTVLVSSFKPIEDASLDSIVAEVTYHDGFTPVDHSKKKPSSGAPPTRGLAAASANTNSDRNGKVWQTPFEWLAVYGEKGIKSRWSRAMAGTGICPICHKDVTPRHLPTQCPILAEFNLKLISVGGSTTPAPTPSPARGSTPTGQTAAATAPPPAPTSGSSSSAFSPFGFVGGACICPP